jgi:hypothetical protein
VEAVDVLGGDAGLEGDPLPQGLPLEFLELLGGLGRLLLRLLEFGEVAVLEVLESLLEGLPLAAFLREVGEDGVLVALAGLRVALVALALSVAPGASWVVSSGAVAASSGVVVVSCSDMGGFSVSEWLPGPHLAGGSRCDPEGSDQVPVGPEERGQLGAVASEALDGAHREPLTALQPLPGDARVS